MRAPQAIASPEELGEILRLARRSQKLTQTRAAALAGVSPRLWNETEKGKRLQLGFATAVRMLHVLGLDMQVTSRRNTASEETER